MCDRVRGFTSHLSWCAITHDQASLCLISRAGGLDGRLYVPQRCSLSIKCVLNGICGLADLYYVHYKLLHVFLRNASKISERQSGLDNRSSPPLMLTANMAAKLFPKVVLFGASIVQVS